ncbi:MAG: hypothetical protein E7K90_20395 [Hafnia alvei]|uniref:hypothetical protein n=1 Tax=Hafnia alvei TaxID=569 RepID=UPI002912D3FF|nr:hypothetical protein [Hafnia alvei]MDU7483729.1 hypothetical protein [Hafnia alvei]
MEKFIKNMDSTTIGALVGSIGSLSAAIIGVIGTLIVIYFTKRQRLGIEVKSKHRQDWINSLRKDISLICEKSNFIVYDLRTILKIEHIQNVGKNNSLSAYIIEYGRVQSAYFNVKLFLNPVENNHIDLDAEINNLTKNLMIFININLVPDNEINPDTNKEFRDKIANNIVKITELSQKIFKSEWIKIKKGK